MPEINLDLVCEEIKTLKDNIAEGKFILKQREKALGEEELKLQVFLNQNEIPEFENNFYKFQFKETKRTAFDQNLFGEEHPKLLKKYKIEKTSFKFEFQIKK